MTDEEVDALEQTLIDFNEYLEDLDRPGMIEKDNQFHDMIFEATRNNKLIEIVQDLHDQFQRFRLIYFNEFDNFYDLRDWHQKIFDAIKVKDEESARHFAEEHIREIQKSVVAWKESQKNDKEKGI